MGREQGKAVLLFQSIGKTGLGPANCAKQIQELINGIVLSSISLSADCVLVLQERIWVSGKPVRISSMETNPRSKKKQKKSTSECENFPFFNSLCVNPITFHRFSFSK